MKLRAARVGGRRYHRSRNQLLVVKNKRRTNYEIPKMDVNDRTLCVRRGSDYGSNLSTNNHHVRRSGRGHGLRPRY